MLLLKKELNWSFENMASGNTVAQFGAKLDAANKAKYGAWIIDWILCQMLRHYSKCENGSWWYIAGCSEFEVQCSDLAMGFTTAILSDGYGLLMITLEMYKTCQDTSACAQMVIIPSVHRGRAWSVHMEVRWADGQFPFPFSHIPRASRRCNSSGEHLISAIRDYL